MILKVSFVRGDKAVSVLELSSRATSAKKYSEVGFFEQQNHVTSITI
jgi:hypothetical protein